MEKFNTFNNAVENLSCVNRFSPYFLSKPENVLEHTGKVALICLQISEELSTEGYEVDQSALLKKALLHDLEESKLGDVVRPLKYSSKEMRDAFQDYECTTASEILSASFTDSGSIFLTWGESKEGKEGSIVSFSDTLCALLKIDDEINQRGNKTMGRALSKTAVQTIKANLQKMDKHFPESKTLKDLRSYCIGLCTKLSLIERHARGTNEL